MGVVEPKSPVVSIDDRPEFELSDQAYLASHLNPETDDDEVVEGLDTEPIGESGARDSRVTEIEWQFFEVDVQIWGTDGTDFFEIETTTIPDSEGRISLSVDFSAVQPGTSFQIAVRNERTVLYSGTGRVVAERSETADAQQTLRESCANLRRLLWICEQQSVLSGPSTEFVHAHEGISDWERIRTERDELDSANSTVSTAQAEVVGALADLESLDPAAVPEALSETIDPIRRLGLDQIIDLTDKESGPDAAEYWVGANRSLTSVRARIDRVLDNPTLYNDGASSRLLKYDHAAGVLLNELDDGETAAAYLDAFLAQPGWAIRYLDREFDGAAATAVRDLSAWLYDHGALAESRDLETQLTALAAAARKLPALSALFEELPTGDAVSHHATFAAHLDTIAAALPASSPPDDSGAQTAFDEQARTAATALTTAISTQQSSLDPLVGGPAPEEAFRQIALERLRDAMTVAASYGVFGGTPTEPDGGTQAITDRLLEQARGLLKRLRTHIEEAAVLDPRLDGRLTDQPIAQRVETQTDRLERLFGDGFTVLVPFSPTNREELRTTFTDDGLLPDEQPMAAETWLTRSAAHRERVDNFTQMRSYAAAISGSVNPSPSVGQVPYQPGDTWVGVEDVEPEPGRISLVAQFGPGIDEGFDGGEIVGLSVDEWTETVPSKEETTGIALNYDDPGNRPPQSVLLVPPPTDGAPSLDHLAATVAETAEYAKRRAVDPTDLKTPFSSSASGDNEAEIGTEESGGSLDGLLPAINIVRKVEESGLDAHDTPAIPFEMLDRYDKQVVEALLPKGLNVHRGNSQ
jgi:hypothetical protein